MIAPPVKPIPKLPRRSQSADGGVIRDRVTYTQMNDLRGIVNEVLDFLHADPWKAAPLASSTTAGSNGGGGGV